MGITASDAHRAGIRGQVLGLLAPQAASERVWILAEGYSLTRRGIALFKLVAAWFGQGKACGRIH
jgi:hypothetical protein